ncbi:Acg family FMN-binding oxidoreductase [Streptomyces sp. NPDC059637]|uniref:Acg family FMN-binding oxidoreductase n=1 Tax=Streptomyces sp. NPDC059637 TaxID=3347752 RepID=UPI00367665E6
MRTWQPLGEAALRKLVLAAEAAPSIHNSQPWRFRYHPDTGALTVHSVEERVLPHLDPLGHALHLSIGAALFNLCVAARHLGHEPVVRLLPDPASPHLLASVHMTGHSEAGARAGPDLYAVIPERHTSRVPFDDEPVPGEVLAELVEAAREEDATLHFPEPQEKQRLLALTSEADRRTTMDPDRTEESRRWVHAPDRSGAGMPQEVLGARDTGAHLPMRDFTGLAPDTLPPRRAFERNPTIGLLATRNDHPEDWLRAGMALEHVLLLATAHGLRASLMHQAMEWPDLRWALRDPERGILNAHMLIRMGRADTHPGTPRRPLREVLETGALQERSP